MVSWLHIGNTGVNILEILELISKGYTCAEIRLRFPDLSPRDLARSAAEILDQVVIHVSADILFEAQGGLNIGPQACFHDDTPWTEDEDEELRRLTRYRFGRRSVARLLRRSERAVSARIEHIKNVT